MRTARFETYLRDLLAGSGNPAIKDVKTFTDAGISDLPAGVEVSFVTGARILLQIVRTSPPGGEKGDQAEKVTEGDVLPAVAEPAFTVDDHVDVKAFETWLTARLHNSGSPEIQDVRTFQGRSHRYGIDVTCHNGAHLYTYFAHTLRAGQATGAHPIYEAKDRV